MKQIFALIIILLISLNYYSSCQWEEMNSGLYKGKIVKILLFNDTIYAAVDEMGIYYSTDKGIQWTRMKKSPSPRCFYVDTNLIVVGTWGNGIFLSKDRGQSWISKNNGLPSNYITAVFSKDGVLFAGVWGYGVYISSDEGDNWVRTYISSGRAYSFIAKDDYIFVGTDDGVFFSDNDTLWYPTNLRGVEVYSLAVNGTWLFAGASNAMYISTDKGKKWTKFQFPTAVVQDVQVVGDTILTATSIGIYYSTNNGNNWKIITPISDSPNTFSILFFDGIILAGTYENGLLYSSDWGSTWAQLGFKFAYELNALTATGETLLAATDSGIFISWYMGKTWGKSRIANKFVNTIHYCNGYVFAGVKNEILFSTNYGLSWTNLQIGSVLVKSPLTFDCNSNYVFAGGEGAYFAYSTFPVKSFKEDFFYSTVSSLKVLDTVVLIGSYQGVYTNSIPPSFPTLLGLPDRAVLAIESLNGNIIAGTVYGIFVSTDFGLTWELRNNGIPKQNITSLRVWNNIIFAGGDYGLYYSTDLGQTWQIAYSQNYLPKSPIVSILIVDQYLYIADKFLGIFRSKLNNYVSSVKEMQPNYSFTVRPNPTNNLLTIEFPLEIGIKNVKILNVLGLEVINDIEIKNNNLGNIFLKVDRLPIGSYIVVIELNNGKINSFPFVKF